MFNFGIRFSFWNANDLTDKSLESEHSVTADLIDVMLGRTFSSVNLVVSIWMLMWKCTRELQRQPLQKFILLRSDERDDDR